MERLPTDSRMERLPTARTSENRRHPGISLAIMAALLAISALLLAGCGVPFAAPAVAPTPVPTRPPRPTATHPPSATPSATPTLRPTPTGTSTPTATPSPTATATPTATRTPTATPHPYWTPTPTPLPTPAVISRGTAAGKLIALTFDCGASPCAARDVLDLLQQDGVPASFGLTGRWAEQNPSLVRRMAAQGEQIIDSGYDYQSFTGPSTRGGPPSPARIRDELERADAVIRHLTGNTTRPFYRPPHGDETARTRSAAAADGYNIDVRWTVDALGADGDSARQIAERVVDEARPGGIIRMHAGQPSRNAAALPGVIAGLRAKGYRFVTVAALLAANHAPGAPHPHAPLSYRDIDSDAVYYPGTGSGPLAGRVVVLDPGHGGNDPGTCYPYTYGCYPSSDPDAVPILDEKTVALDLALYHLLPRLHLLGADVYLTRTTPEQNPRLESRLQLANYVSRVRKTHGRALFISVHLNGSDFPSADYAQALYAAHRPSALAARLVGAVYAALRPAPSDGDHGIATFPGHVLRRNRLPASIAEPVFLTNVYPVYTPISVTQIITTTSGEALRRGLRLHNPVVSVVVRPPRPSVDTPTAGLTPTLTFREAFSGTVGLERDVIVARTNAFSVAKTISATTSISLTAPPTPTLPLTVSIPASVTYAISVSGAISATSVMTTYAGEGPWLSAAHAATVRANGSAYDTPAPTTLPIDYAWNDREETIARGLLQGIAAYFDVELARQDLRPRRTPVALRPVIPPD